MLLQALDLLDRGLVTRLVLSSLPSQPQLHAQSQPETENVSPPQADIHLQGAEEEKEMGKERQNVVYKVMSSQQPSRFKDAGNSKGGQGQVYTVRLRAWNCSCAAFVFSCYPSSTHYPPPHIPHHTEEGEGKGGWEFGGMSFDGKGEGGNVPVCKHLLACLLGERWEGVLGKGMGMGKEGYVGVKGVGRGEMGGFGGE